MILDSSIYASIIVADEFYERAKEVIKTAVKSSSATLDIAFPEAANVLWKHVFLLRRIPIEEVEVRVDKLINLIEKTSRIFNSKEFLSEALKIALENEVTVYDALYLALSLKLNTKLYTFDEKLKEIVKDEDLRGKILVP